MQFLPLNTLRFDIAFWGRHNCTQINFAIELYVHVLICKDRIAITYFKKREHINLPICWHLGNLKNTHVGDHQSIPCQPSEPYLGTLSIHQSFDKWTCIPTNRYDYTLPIIFRLWNMIWKTKNMTGLVYCYSVQVVQW